MQQRIALVLRLLGKNAVGTGSVRRPRKQLERTLAQIAQAVALGIEVKPSTEGQCTGRRNRRRRVGRSGLFREDQTIAPKVCRADGIHIGVDCVLDRAQLFEQAGRTAGRVDEVVGERRSGQARDQVDRGRRRRRKQSRVESDGGHGVLQQPGKNVQAARTCGQIIGDAPRKKRAIRDRTHIAEAPDFDPTVVDSEHE